MKDLKLKSMCGYYIWFCDHKGAAIQVHKSLLNLFDEEEEEPEANIHEFLAYKKELTPENFDFTSKSALLQRQRMILD